MLSPDRTWFVVGTILFGTGGVLGISDGRWFGWFVLACGVFGFVVLIWATFSPKSRLRLSPRGFEFGSMKRVSSYLWSDISEFFPARFAGGSWVCFTFSEKYSGETKVRHVNQRFGKFDRFLPNNYGLSAEDLAGLLERWRSRFGNAKASTADGDDVSLSE